MRATQTFEAPDDLVRESHCPPPARRRNDELGPAVVLFGATLDISELLELVNDPPNHLAVPA
jgi:hypothetical protein